MPRIHQNRYHKIKRLYHRDEHKTINSLPVELFNKTLKYNKYFDYPLAQLIADHSTDPLQNTCRQYTNQLETNPIEGRFANHEMIIRRNGETTIHRPKHDLVLANGFTPVIRPSSILPAYHSIISDRQPESSLSINDKMSMKKDESTSVIKTKRNRRKRRQKNKISKINHDIPDTNLVQAFKQTLYDLIERTQPKSSRLDERPRSNSSRYKLSKEIYFNHPMTQ